VGQGPQLRTRAKLPKTAIPVRRKLVGEPYQARSSWINQRQGCPTIIT